MSEKMINVTINGMKTAVPQNTTILDAARTLGIDIPTLCYLRGINMIGSCRICVVEVKGLRGLTTSCVYPVFEGMEVWTNTPEVQQSRRFTLELILSNHRRECLSCVRSRDCELQKLCRDLGVDDELKYEGERHTPEIDYSAPHMYRDNSKCVLCRRCVAACSKLQAVSVIGANDRGFDTHIGCAFEMPLSEVPCIACGQCIVACPTGALSEKDQSEEVFALLNDKKKHVIVQTAPSVRVTLGEWFDMAPGTNVKGKMVAALRRLGFAGVFDTDIAADLTIMEEAHELLERVGGSGPLPMITSCSPGWVKYCEHFYPDYIDHLSTCKSPQQMFGAMAKTYYAQKMGLDPQDIAVVSIMPCTAKKFEVTRDFESASGVPDVDIALTTRELGRMIDRAGISFSELPDEEFDAPFGISTGAGAIFGATGGVMEAALRTAATILTGEEQAALEFCEVRGTQGVKEASYQLGDIEVKVAVASGTANAKKLMDKIAAGEADYHFIEIMGCPGGCVNGGGQPPQIAKVRNNVDLAKVRAAALYCEDENLPLRRSHESPVIKALYDDYLGKPGSHLAHDLLHTRYVKRTVY